MPHATTRLASFLGLEGACLVALVWSVCLCEPPWASPGRLQLHVASWLVGCPRAAEAACDVILLQVDLAVVLVRPVARTPLEPGGSPGCSRPSVAAPPRSVVEEGEEEGGRR